jgi:hypothetical protein
MRTLRQLRRSVLIPARGSHNTTSLQEIPHLHRLHACLPVLYVVEDSSVALTRLTIRARGAHAAFDDATTLLPATLDR